MLPSMSEYREALQHPHVAFKAPDLKHGVVKQTPLGLPLLVSGGFALTACITTQTGSRQSLWAIRCFHKQAPDLQARYKYISNFLQSKNDDFFVKFHYEPEGIKVGGNWHPIVRMNWVNGQPFHEFIEANLNDPLCLQSLARQFASMSNKLHDLGMAHGDLQHGNILVRQGKLVLIDYDGMYVPGMPYQNSNELGHVAFQHPKRDRSFFNETIDHFSSIAIYISLLCLATPRGPELWQQYHTGENLIFTKQDYNDPRNSTLFTEIQRNLEIEPDRKLRRLIDKFQGICLENLDMIPPLDQLLNDQLLIEPIQSSPKTFWEQLKAFLVDISQLSQAGFQGQHKVFSAHNILQLIKQDGEKVAVVGRVNSIAEYREDSDLIAAFINFGHLKRDSIKQPNLTEYRPFTVVIFAQGLESLLKIKKLRSTDLKDFEGKYLMITGLLERIEYKHGKYRTPQIILENARQLTSITDEEAIKLLASSQKTMWEKLRELWEKLFKRPVEKKRKVAQKV